MLSAGKMTSNWRIPVLISYRFYIFIDLYHCHFQEKEPSVETVGKAVPRLQRGVHAVCDFPTMLDT